MPTCKKLKTRQYQNEEVVILEEEIVQESQKQELIVLEATYSIEKFSIIVFPKEEANISLGIQIDPKTNIVSQYKELNLQV